jgi:hypothetical protein
MTGDLPPWWRCSSPIPTTRCCSGRGAWSAVAWLAGCSAPRRCAAILCQADTRAWRADGQPPLRRWLRHGARSLRGERVAVACAAVGCRRSVDTHSLCYAHRRHWQRAGCPPIATFARAAPAVRTSSTACAVFGCRFPAIAGQGLCDTHHRSFGWLATRRPGLEPADYVAHLATARQQLRPRFDLRGVGTVVALELGYALQCRHDQRGAAITPLIFGQVVRWLRERPVDSLLIGSDAAWGQRRWWALHAEHARQPAGLASLLPRRAGEAA